MEFIKAYIPSLKKVTEEYTHNTIAFLVSNKLIYESIISRASLLLINYNYIYSNVEKKQYF